MKKMITTLKSAMKLITIQLRTKMKILTKYVVKPYFYDVILWMIFWNMKYLFYNCLLLLLCCACCKFAIQAFVQRINRQYKQNLQKIDSFTDGFLPVDIVLRVAKQLRHFATLSDSYTNEMVPVGILLRVVKKLRPLPHSPTYIPTHSPIDGAHSNAHDCQTAWSVDTFIERFANGHGKSNARALTHSYRRICQWT
jgi:hypothetical protein